MTMENISIALMKYNSSGICTCLENEEDMESIEVHVDPCTTDHKAVCVETASRLRVLADAFERLSVMDDPFRESTQEAALDAAMEAAGFFREEI